MAKMNREPLLRCLGLLSLGLLMLTGCSMGGEESATVTSSRLSLRLTTADPVSGSALRRAVSSSPTLRVASGDRLFVTRLEVSVSGPNFAGITQSFDVGESEQEKITVELQERVPTRQSLTIAVAAFNTFNGQEELIFRGQREVNLARSVEEVTIELIRQFLPASLTPDAFSSRISNRAFRFADGAAFGVEGEVILRFGAVVNNSGPFTLTSGGVTAAGTVTIRPQTSSSSQQRMAASGQLRQGESSLPLDFNCDTSTLPPPACQAGETVSGSIEMDDLNDSVNLTTGLGTSVSDPPELLVNAAPEVTLNADKDTVVAGGTVDFSATCIDPDTPLTFAWSVDGTALAETGLGPVSIPFPSPGTVSVTFTCTDALGASASASRTVTVENPVILVDLVVTLRDVTTDAVLDGATVTVDGQPGTTDAGGLATFTGVAVGEIPVTVSRDGYLTHAFARVIHTDTTGLNLFIYPLGEATLDTDSDGIPDGVETNTGIFLSALNTGTDPNTADTDGDLLNDGVEILVEEVRLGD